jgi:putative transcriptional regulator
MEGMDQIGDLGAGMLLVATPELVDPGFRRTVVYLVAHGDEGTVGVILNRPSETAVHNVLPGWQNYVSAPRALYVGGPVQTNGAMCLGVRKADVDPATPEGLARVSGPVVLVDLDSEPAEITPMLRGLRIYAGHAGWDDGQLEREIAEGSWHVLQALPDDLIAGPRVDLYFRVLRRQPMPFALNAYHPGDLTRN